MNHGNMVATLGQLAHGPRVPLMWNVRQTLDAGHHDKWLTRKLIRFNAFISGRPDVIIYNSRAGAAQHEAIGYCADRQRVIPNGFDLDAFSPLAGRRLGVRRALGVREDEILIGLIARFDPWKNHSGFLAACSQIAEAEPKARFLMAGAGMDAGNVQLSQLMQDPKVAARSLMLGTRDDINELTAALDIACNVSHGESFANTIGEAMACEVPCVVTDVGDSSWIVGNTGIVCSSGDAGAVAAALREMIAIGDAARRELGRAARQRIETNFSLPAIVEEYDQAYEQLV